MSEQDYTHLSLHELKRITYARLGFQTGGDAATMTNESLNEFIRAASLWGYQKTPWHHARRTCKGEIGVEQGIIAFPKDCGPGNILQVAVANDANNGWIILERAQIGLSRDIDLAFDTPDEKASHLSVPNTWTVRDTILVRPFNNKLREWKILYTLAPKLIDDRDRTIIDGELIVLRAMYLFYQWMEEDAKSLIVKSDAEERIQHLRGEQQTREQMNFHADTQMDIAPGAPFPEQLPRIDRTPQPAQHDTIKYVEGGGTTS